MDIVLRWFVRLWLLVFWMVCKMSVSVVKIVFEGFGLVCFEVLLSVFEMVWFVVILCIVLFIMVMVDLLVDCVIFLLGLDDVL